MNSILRRSEVLSGDVPAFVAGGGECATLIGGLDWSLSPLGPIEGWPDSLRTATAIVLRSPLLMALLWGPDGILLYNDGYAPFTGGRHPAALGRPMRETLPDLLGFDEDALRLGLAGGTRSYKDVELLVDRGGRAEPAFLNLDYSPVPDDDGHPAGVLAIVAETAAALGARALREAEAQARAGAERVQLALDAGAVVGTWH